MSFEVSIITPFAGVTLEVGGDVETYWKSTAMPVYRMSSHLSPSRSEPRPGGTASAQNSPTIRSNKCSSGHPPAISSLRGSYVYFVVQVTRDLHPVVYANWLLPESRFDISVSDVTLAQFEALATTLGRSLHAPVNTSAPGWRTLVSQSMISLTQLLQVRHDQLIRWLNITHK